MGTHLSHVDLGSLLEHRSAGHIEALLQAIKPQWLHLLVAALHLQGVVRQLGQLLHVLRGQGHVGDYTAPTHPHTPCLGLPPATQGWPPGNCAH